MSKHTTRALALMAVGALMFTAACTTRNDGGTPTTEPTGGATTSSGGEAPAEFTVAFVPKIQGIPYFEAMNAGGKKAEEVIPGLKWEYQGPTTADPAATPARRRPRKRPCRVSPTTGARPASRSRICRC